MSENQSSKPVPHADNKNAQGSRIDGVNKPLASSEQPMTIESAQQPDDDTAPRAESNSPKESLALAPGEISNVVTFKLEIPADALPGTYDYTFVVDSP